MSPINAILVRDKAVSYRELYEIVETYSKQEKFKDSPLIFLFTEISIGRYDKEEIEKLEKLISSETYIFFSISGGRGNLVTSEGTSYYRKGDKNNKFPSSPDRKMEFRLCTDIHELVNPGVKYVFIAAHMLNVRIAYMLGDIPHQENKTVIINDGENGIRILRRDLILFDTDWLEPEKGLINLIKELDKSKGRTDINLAANLERMCQYELNLYSLRTQ